MQNANQFKATKNNGFMVFLSYLLFLCLTVTAIIRLSSTFLNNIVVLAILDNWVEINHTETELPGCGNHIQEIKGHQYLDLALQFDPENDTSLLNQGRIAWIEGDCNLAQDSFEAAYQADRKNPVTAFWLFWLYGAKAERTPYPLTLKNLAQYAHSKGWELDQAGEIEGATNWYNLSIRLHPILAVVERLEDIYERSGRLDKSLELWGIITKILPPQDALYWLAKGAEADINQDWLTAADAYEKGAEKATDPRTAASIYIRQAVSLKQVNDWQGAEGAYMAALSRFPEMSLPYIEIGNIRYFLKDYQEALKWYLLAKDRAPQYSAILYHLGETYYQLSQLDEAIDLLQTVIELEPLNAKAHYLLAQCLYAQERKLEAISILSMVIEKNPERTWQWAAQLGDWNLETGNRQDALFAYRQALEWNPENSELKEKLRLFDDILPH